MLGRKAALGGLLMVGARLVTRVIDLISMLILARVLAPTDFGLVAIALSAVSVMEAALEMPVNQALVRLPAITGPQYDTAFTLSLLRGALLSTVLILAAWPFSHFYADGRLLPLVCLLSLAPVSRGLVSPRLAEYQRGMSFWRDFSMELGSKLVAFSVGILLALLTHSYWSIAIASVTFPLAATLASYALAPYRPRLTLSELPVFTGFVGWLSLAQMVNALNWQFERLLLGKLMSTARLGTFTAASDVASIPFLAFFGPLLRPLLAAFSRLRDDQRRLGQSYLAASGAITAVGLPLLVGESLLADPIVQLVLGDKWLAAIPLVHWLSLSLIPALLAMPAGPLVMCCGATRLFVTRNLLEFSIKLPVAVLGALQFGFFGVVAARFLSEIATGAYCMVTVRRLTGVTVAAQLLVSWRTVAATGVMIPFVLICAELLQPGASLTRSAGGLMLVGTTGAAVYTTSLFLLWRLSGRPSGFEAMAFNAVAGLLGRMRRARPLPADHAGA